MTVTERNLTAFTQCQAQTLTLTHYRLRDFIEPGGRIFSYVVFNFKNVKLEIRPSACYNQPTTCVKTVMKLD